jgi:DUF3047 family protein
MACRTLSFQSLIDLHMNGRFPFDGHVLSYIWDTTAPQGTMENASSPPLAHVCAIVCRSGMADANRRIAESHNVGADYLRALPSENRSPT